MSKYNFMQEAWGIDGNPFPAETIHQGNEPYSDDVFPEEQEQFNARLIYGAAMDRRGFGYLWSKGRGGDDTGFGKTTLLRNSARAINQDMGHTVLTGAGMPSDKTSKHRAIAGYASLTTTDRTGVYPILFAAVEYLADPRNGINGISVIDQLRAAIRKEHGLKNTDIKGLRQIIESARRKLGMTLVPLREDALESFCAGEDGDFAAFLGEVSATGRVRNGLAYFDFAFTVAHAAGIRHLFVFVDQLEDLANNQTVTRAKRSREIGRLRDIIAEMEPFAGHVHFVFTFHIRAAQVLLDMWAQNRLPSFDPEDKSNEGSVVVLRGIRDTDQVRTLLKTYLDPRREEGPADKILPFKEDVLPVLLQRSGGRAGILLSLAYKLFDRAADAERAEIDRHFAEDLLMADSAATDGRRRPAPDLEQRDALAIDELLN
jgi:hypothetical protein